MKLDSKLFDPIRIRSRQPEDEPRPNEPCCAWEGCSEVGRYRAPKGNRAEGEYHNFCLEHVRHYNAAFNFFSGMPSEEIEATLNRARETDGRPDWGLGGHTARPRPSSPRGQHRHADPLNLFARLARNRAKTQGGAARPRQHLHEPDRQAFETLGFQGAARPEEIKQAFKVLVKRHHPDANGGDKASEERLRTIIAAYSHLKAKGFVGR